MRASMRSERCLILTAETRLTVRAPETAKLAVAEKHMLAENPLSTAAGSIPPAARRAIALNSLEVRAIPFDERVHHWIDQICPFVRAALGKDPANMPVVVGPLVPGGAILTRSS